MVSGYISTVNDNGSLIRSYVNQQQQQQQAQQPDQHKQKEEEQQQKDQSSESDQSDESDTTKNTNEEKIIEKTSISDAIRRNAGIYAVTGTIIGVSILSKTISKVSTYCEKCGITDEVIFNPIPVSNIKSIKENCKSCGKHIQFYNIKPT